MLVCCETQAWEHEGNFCVCRNGHGAIGCHILLLEGESSLAGDCLGLPVEFREVTALSSVPVL